MTSGAPTSLFPETAPLLGTTWPTGVSWPTGPWPTPHGLPPDRLGPDDGTALELRAVGQPVSIALWRNVADGPRSPRAAVAP
ncbi:hypothetical protein [Streptomyces sp. NPDC057740]|uniref:hypothetical protein n=1 Tax=Streptomyces sp. NPDC057740 TaxID=3346234 RepID=UPI0036C322B0